MSSNNIIWSDSQYDFRAKHSTDMAMLDMYGSISKVMDQTELLLYFFVDLSKALDTINHDILDCHKIMINIYRIKIFR